MTSYLIKPALSIKNAGAGCSLEICVSALTISGDTQRKKRRRVREQVSGEEGEGEWEWGER